MSTKSLSGGEEPFRASPVKDLGVSAEDAGDDPTTRGHPAGGGRRYRGGDTVDRGEPGPVHQVVVGDPHHDGRAVEGEVGLVAAERVFAEPDEGIGLHLNDRPARDVGVGGPGPLRVTGCAHLGRDEGVDRGLHGCAVFGSDPAGQLEHPVHLPHDEMLRPALLILARRDPVRVQPRLRTDQHAVQLIHRQPGRLLDERLLRRIHSLSPGAERDPVQQADDRPRRSFRDRRGRKGRGDVRVPRRSFLPGQQLPWRGRFADFHQACRIPRRGAAGSGDQRRRIAEPLRLRQPLGPQLRAGSSGDLRRQRRLIRVEHPPHPAVPLVHRDQIAVTQRPGIRARPDRPHGTDLHVKQIKPFGHRTNVLTTSDIAVNLGSSRWSAEDVHRGEVSPACPLGGACARADTQRASHRAT